MGSKNLLAIVDKVAINIRVHVSLGISVFVFWGKYPVVKLLDHGVVLFMIF